MDLIWWLILGRGGEIERDCQEDKQVFDFSNFMVSRVI